MAMKTLNYGTTGNGAQVLDLYEPDKNIAGAIPTIICVHGGGWSGEGRQGKAGDKAKQLAKTGRARAASLEFRGTPTVTWPSILNDLRLAMTFLTARLGVKQSFMAGIGYSSGGHLVACLAIEALLRRAVICSAPTSLAIHLSNSKKSAKSIKALCPTGNYDEASPAMLVDADTAPMQLWYGTKDTCPISQGLALFDAMISAERECSIHTYNGAHTFENVAKTEMATIDQTINNFLLAV